MEVLTSMGYVFDNNVHLFEADAQGNPVPAAAGKAPSWWVGGTAELVLEQMAQAGIDHVLAVAYGPYDDDYLVACAQRHPESFSVVGKMDPSAPTAAATLDRLASTPGIRGIRFEAKGDNANPSDWLNNPKYRAMWGQADRLGVPISLNRVREMDHLIPLRRVLDRFPSLKIVLRRMVLAPTDDGPPYRAAQNLFALAEFPNVYSTFSDENIKEADSGDSTYEAFFEEFIGKFGANRLMWASFFPAHRGSARMLTEDSSSDMKDVSPSDFPDEAPMKGLLDYVRAKLSFLPQGVLDAILGENSRRLYELP